jgi:hypothetical protein
MRPRGILGCIRALVNHGYDTFSDRRGAVNCALTPAGRAWAEGEAFMTRHPRGSKSAISGLQLRAARGFLCWDQRDLAMMARVPLIAVEQLETRVEPTSELAGALAAIVISCRCCFSLLIKALNRAIKLQFQEMPG